MGSRNGDPLHTQVPRNLRSPWHESNLIWGPIAIGIGIVLAVVAAMVKDIRWLLWFAWPFLSLGIWGLCRGIRVPSWRRSIVVAGALGVFCLLGWLYRGLAPAPIVAQVHHKIDSTRADDKTPANEDKPVKKLRTATPRSASSRKKESKGIEVDPAPVQSPVSAQGGTATGTINAPHGNVAGTIIVQPGGVSSIGQQGGITAQQVTIGQQRKPDRRIPPELQQSMISELSKTPGIVHISAFVGDVDAYQLATQLYDIFGKAKWELRNGGVRSFMIGGKPWTGIRVNLPMIGTVGEQVNVDGWGWGILKVFDAITARLKFEYEGQIVVSKSNGEAEVLVGPQAQN